MTEKPETRLTKRILKALRNQGGFWVRIHGGPYQVTGLPDIIGCLGGRFYGLEVKVSESRKPTARQQLILDTIRRNRGVSGVITGPSEALEAIRETRLRLATTRKWLTASQAIVKIGYGLGKERPISLWRLGRLVERGDVKVRKYGQRTYYSSKSIDSFLGGKY